MVHAALAVLIPLAYTTATNALPVDPPLTSRYDNSRRGLSRRVQRGGRGGASWTSPARCYTDNVAARTFTGAELVSDSMTTEACLDFCYSKGYKYAGTEWGKECFCDSDFRNGGVPADSGCDMPCAGANDETCGGGIRLSVYENTGDLSPPPPTSPGWSSQGCYTDSVANRALPNQVHVDGDMTVDKCTTQCLGQGFTFAGVEFARECFCGSAIGPSGTPATTGCDMPCTGDSNEICGGGDRLNIYQYTGAAPLPSTGDWVLDGDTGCYTDVVANRALGLRVYVDGAMTVPKCTAKCLSLNFGYAGVEFADECYCSNAIGSSGTPASDGCTMSCSGDITTICGGPDRLTVYKYQGNALTTQPTVLNSYNSFTTQGCYTDSIYARLMTLMKVAGPMTVEKCIDACSAQEYDVAGVEFGGECFCSASMPADSFKATDNCNMPCAGDAAHLCGGADRLNVYRYQAPVTTTSTTVSTTGTSVSTSSTSASTAPAFAPWVYQGCADVNHNSDIFNELALENSKPDQLTISTCLDHCSSIGSETAMLSATWCWCNQAQVSGLLYEAGRCNLQCAGDSSQTCGGSTAASVYFRTYPSTDTSNTASETGTSTSTSTSTAATQASTSTIILPQWNDMGCTKIKDTSKVVLNADFYDYDNDSDHWMSVDGCERTCLQWDWSFGAYIQGTKCYCVKEPFTQTFTDGTCNAPCGGNRDQICGGAGAFTVVSFSKPSLPAPAAPAGWTYLGCSENAYGTYDPNNHGTYLSNTEPAYNSCINFCTGKNPYAIIQGSACNCVNNLSATVAYGSQRCLSQFGSDPTQLVGTPNSNTSHQGSYQVFKVNSTPAQTATGT